MSNLGDFGVDVPEQEETSTETAETESKSERRTYAHGRCRGISKSTSLRCASSARYGEDLCAVHEREFNPVTIDSDPEDLVKMTGGMAGRCRALQRNDERCDNSTYPVDLVCGTHEDTADVEIVAAAECELDQELIRDAIAEVTADA